MSKLDDYFSQVKKDIATKQAKTTEQRNNLRSKGLPVSVNPKKVAPSMAGTLIRDAIKLPARIAASAQGPSKQYNTIKTDYLGDVKPIGVQGDINVMNKRASGQKVTTKDQVKALGTDLKDTASVAAEIASYVIGGGTAKGATTATKSGLKILAKSLAKEGAYTSALQSLGSSGQQDRNLKDTAKRLAVDVPLGTAATVAGGTILNKVFGKAKPTASQRIEEVIKGKPETISIPEKAITNQLPESLPNEPAIKPQNPKEVTMPIPGTKPEAIKAPEGKVMTPGGNIAPKVQIGEPVKVPTEVKARQAKALNALPDDEFTPQVKETSRNFYNEDPERAFRMLDNNEPVPAGVNKRALYALAKIDATGEKAVRLAELRGVSSKAGQDLSMLNQGDTNGVVNKIVEINDTLKKNLSPKQAKQAIKELNDEIRATAPTVNELDKILQDLTCPL